MVTSVDYPIHLGLAYLFLGGLDGFYGKVHVDGKLWRKPLAAGRLHFQPLLPCREPAGSRRNHCHSAKKRSIWMYRSVLGPYQGFSQQKASKQTPRLSPAKDVKNKEQKSQTFVAWLSSGKASELVGEWFHLLSLHSAGPLAGHMVFPSFQLRCLQHDGYDGCDGWWSDGGLSFDRWIC